MPQFSTNGLFALGNKISQTYRHKKVHVYVFFDRTKEKVKIANIIKMCAAKLNFAKLPNENNVEVFTHIFTFLQFKYTFFVPLRII
jgi:hypothetical protein